MIKIPKCTNGHQIIKFCIHQKCSDFAFICENCQYLHEHQQKQKSVTFQQIHRLLSLISEDDEYHFNIFRNIHQNEFKTPESQKFVWQQFVKVGKNIQIVGWKLKGLQMSIWLEKLKFYESFKQSKVIEKKSFENQIIQNTAESFYQNGLKYFTQQKYQLAQIAFEKVTEMDNSKYRTFFYLEKIWKRLKKHQIIEIKYSNNINSDVNNPMAYYKRGRLRHAKCEYQKALEDINKAILLDPFFAIAYNSRGVIFYMRGQIQKSLKEYNKCLQINPNIANSYNNIGLIHYNNQQLQKALEYINKALEYDPEFSMAYNNAGLVFYKRKQYSKAMDYYNMSIKYDQENHLPYYNKGIIYEHQKKSEEAIKCYTQSIECDPKYPRSYNNRGIIYHNQKEFDKALLDYRKAIQNDPKYFRAYYNQGLIHSFRKQYDKSLQNHSKAIEINPKYQIAYLQRGIIYFTIFEKYDLAKKDLNKSITCDPNQSYYYLGRIYLRQKLLLAALQYFSKVIEIQGIMEYQSYLYRGIVLDSLTDADKAQDDYELALQMNQKNSLNMLKQIYRELRKMQNDQ